ncbi:MAG: alkaline phosphatase family protein [Syntrophobacteraceae bacterium]
MKHRRNLAYTSLMLCGIMLLSVCNSDPAAATGTRRKVILFVWDGLRPDSVTQKATPNLWGMSQRGVFFHKNHSTYPTFTMMNSSSFNTGDFPGKTGFYGNWLWLGPNTLQGNDFSNKLVHYSQPVFTEDWNILTSLNGYYNGHLFLVTRLLEAAQAKGLKTCIVGKSGAAFMFDLTRGGCGIDENMVFPESLATELQKNGYPLPKNTPVMWPGITLASDNGSPTAFGTKTFLCDGVTLDPTAGTTSIFYSANLYMLGTYLNYVLPNKDPDVSVIWFRDPDSTEHLYGPGSPAYRDSLATMDTMLGQILAKLKALGIYDNTDIMVVSDHGHSSVAGDVSLFPLRDIRNGKVVTTVTNPVYGYSVSGDVRLAQLLTDNGIAANVYDGSGCIKDPVMSGILPDGAQVYPTLEDTDGTVCGNGPGCRYNTRSFVVPSSPPEDAVVIAANGGSDYLYVPNKNVNTVKGIVSFLQSREEFGAIFVDDNYGSVRGTFKMSTVNLEMAGRSPDIIVSYNYNENATVQGMKGTEYESMQVYRGMHGSFSPVDVHNTLIASGPDFKFGFHDHVPSGNIDVAPTIAYLLSLNLPNTDGRVLYEAIKNSRTKVWVTLEHSAVTSRPVKGLTFYKPTAIMNANCMIDYGKSSFRTELVTSSVKDSTGKSVTYFDYAKALRQ